MTSKTFLLAALLVVSVLPLASAEVGGEGVTIWNESKHVKGFVEVANDTTLIVRGAVLELEDGFIVHPLGKLVLEAGTVLKPGDDNGYLIDNQGRMEVRGRADSPVVIEAIGGAGQNSGDTILFTGGLAVNGGTLDAEHLFMGNYTSGLKAAWNSTVRLRDVTFNATKGLGLVASQGMIHGERLVFRGPGAAYWAVADGHAEIRDSEFQGNGTFAAVVNGNETIFRNVRIDSYDTCIRTTVGRLELHDVECTGFRADGLVVSRPVKGFRMPDLVVKGGRIHTDEPTALSAISIVKAPAHRLDDVSIGPVPRWGLVLESTQLRAGNLTFQGVGVHNVAFINPIVPVNPERIGNGTAGAEGWLFVGFPTMARVVDGEGKPLQGAIFEGKYDNGSLAFRKATPESGLTSSAYLPIMVIGPDGQVTNTTYSLRAFHPEKGGSWSRESYVPDGQMLLVQLTPSEGGGNPVPAPSFGLLVGALVAVALASRYRRSRI